MNVTVESESSDLPGQQVAGSSVKVDPSTMVANNEVYLSDSAIFHNTPNLRASDLPSAQDLLGEESANSTTMVNQDITFELTHPLESARMLGEAFRIWMDNNPALRDEGLGDLTNVSISDPVVSTPSGIASITAAVVTPTGSELAVTSSSTELVI